MTCACGKTARVPPLGVLQHSAGVPPEPELDSPYDSLPYKSPFVCQACGVEADTREVTLHCNIGALVVRFPSYIRGRLCKWCIRDHFWRYTGTTAIAGWWGVVSCVVTPVIIVNNVIQYVRTFGMEAATEDATAPQLTQEAIDRIRPHADQALAGWNSGDDILALIRNVADTASATPGQVLLFLRANESRQT